MPDYAGYVHDVKAGKHKIMPGFDTILPFLEGKQTLDIGCGAGYYLELLGTDAVGMERDPELIEICIEKGLKVIAGDVERRLPFNDGQFEAVLFSHVLEHLERPYDALREIHRVLSPDGVLVLGLPTENNPIRTVFRLDYFNGTHLMAYTVKGAKRVLQLTGFEPFAEVYGNPRMGGQIARLALKVLQRLPGRERLSMYYWLIATRPK